MAGVAGIAEGQRRMGGGPFGELARDQYHALAQMRWSSFRNTLRTNKGAAELGANVAAYLLYSLMGLGLAAGMGAGAYAVASSGKWTVLALIFWVMLGVWQVVPVSLASFQEQFDPGGLLRFPVSFGTFFVLHMIFGLVDVSTILGGFCCAGIWVGLVVARPDLWAWAAVAVAMFAAFNVLLVRAVFAWIDRWLAQRRTREIVSAVFLVLLLSMQLLNPAFHMSKGGGMMSTAARAQGTRWLRTGEAVQNWLPPGMAAQVVEQAVEHRPARSVESLAAIGMYVLAVGGVLGVRLRAGYRGENLSDAPAGDAPARARFKRSRGGRGKDTNMSTGFGWIAGSGPVAAVVEKELRTLFRSLPLLYGVGAPVFMVFVLSGLFARRHTAAGPPAMGFMISLGYAFVGFTQLFYNNLGPEGAGVQLLFLAPTSVRTVVLAKNLFHAVLFGVDAVLVCIVASLRLGVPSAVALVGTAAWLLFALPVHLAAGNAFSLNMPYRMNLGRIGKQRGSQISALLSMLIQGGVLGVGVGVFALCSYLLRLWMAVPMFLVLAAGAWFAWLRVLGKTNEVAERRKELLLSALVRAD